MKKDITVITGCDSGIGKATAELLLSKGQNIAISYLVDNPFIQNELCNAFKMDMLIEDDILNFINAINNLCNEEYNLKCLFNNAGIASGGPVEDLDMSVFLNIFKVNFFAHVQITKSMIPLLKISKGMIINNGSMAGKVAPPFMAPYTSSKFAMEGFTDSLRRELKPFGIKTVVLEPASVATPIWNNAKKIDRSFVSNVYKKSIDEFMDTFVESGNYGLSPEIAAKKIFTIMQKKYPSPRYIISKKLMFSYMQTIAPDRLMDYIAKKVCSINY